MNKKIVIVRTGCISDSFCKAMNEVFKYTDYIPLFINSETEITFTEIDYIDQATHRDNQIDDILNEN